MLYTSTHKKGNFDYTWIGLKRCGTDDPKKFCWTDESEAGFTAWKKDQPSNRPSQPNQRCVAQQMNTGLWNNKECHHDKYLALCERGEKSSHCNELNNSLVGIQVNKLYIVKKIDR